MENKNNVQSVVSIKPTKKKSARKIKTAFSKLAQRGIAAAAASLLPFSSYYVSHYELTLPNWNGPAIETARMICLYLLVGACLGYSSTTIVAWAKTWTGYKWKAVFFTVMLEFCMVLVHAQWLAITCLFFLVAINGCFAWEKSKKKIV